MLIPVFCPSIEIRTRSTLALRADCLRPVIVIQEASSSIAATNKKQERADAHSCFLVRVSRFELEAS